MKKFMSSFITILLTIIGIGIYYYLSLPAINIHSPGLWFLVISILIVICIVIGTSISKDKDKFPGSSNLFKHSGFSITFGLTAILAIVFIVGGILSSPMINATKYQKILVPENRSFTEDIKQISYNKIPILDKASASMLGSRKMGGMMEYVSQFEVGSNYTQINYQATPVRVTPLRYGSFFKWLNNRSKGIPAYIMIDMATEDVDLIKLDTGMKYSESERFSRNIHRYLRFNYPTYMFGTINFEIDDEGIPYWICPVKKYTIGLFGGKTIGRVVVVNAVTGEHKDYHIDDIPTWIDRVFSADLLISLYDYHGTLKHGFWNSIFGQRDALQTTDGYNYMALEDDVWVYTGVTSVGADESNVGFVLMNQRTSETRFYSISGAEEYSAMSSAEGKVQHLGYISTFPLLLNIGEQPTYFMALKDAAGLVKSYAMVNIAQYQIVAIGDTVSECEKTYLALMKSNGIGLADTSTLPKITGTIAKIAEGVIEGTSHYFILLNNSNAIFDINVVDFIQIITYDVGDKITLTYTDGTQLNSVLGIE